MTTIATVSPHVWDVSMDGQYTDRPGGVKHELVGDGETVVVREVWYLSDTGEEQQVDEVRIGINELVHLVVNMTPVERAHFSENRTTRPGRDWDGVPRSD